MPSDLTLPSPSVSVSESGRPRLMVEGKPFLSLGAELHNSSGSSRAALEAGLDRAAWMHANTVLVPIAWEAVEPTEGVFDFALIDAALEGARNRSLRLILLWFGTWKNGRSSYAPAWVKRDFDRFPRALIDGKPVEHVTPFSDAARDSDARAFAALMRHLARHDSTQHTVTMVQVENEVGLLGDSRDRSELAELAFNATIPPELVALLEGGAELAVRATWEARGCPRTGTWTDVLGEGARTDEAFMAFAYAAFVEHVAAAGRAELDVPLFTNAWLDSEIDAPGFAVAGGQRPGTYPSGGPVIAVAPIWRAVAPTLSLLAPDIYVGDFDAICDRYSRANDGALYIPEMRRDEAGAGQIAVAIGGRGAIGVSPFGVDSGEREGLEAIADLYELAGAVSTDILESEREQLAGFHLDADTPVRVISVGDRSFRARMHAAWGGEASAPHSYGIVMQTGPAEFLAVGRGFQLEPIARGDENIGILHVDELNVGPDGLERGRRLNGDETLAGSAWTHPSRGHAASGALPIAAEGENSGISRCSLYAY